MPLWAGQGRRFVDHNALWAAACTGGKTTLTMEHSEKFLEDEAQSLETRYRARPHQDIDTVRKVTSMEMQQIVSRCSEFDKLSFRSSALQEEKERELAPEIEQERQIERPAAADPEDHHLDQDVITFWSQGRLHRTSSAFSPAWSALRDISAASDFDVTSFNRQDGLLVTADFARTVKHSGKSYQSDAYQRPAHWILPSVTADGIRVKEMVLISPFEANALRGIKQKVKDVAMNNYKPDVNLAYESLDKLNYFTFPARAVTPIVPASFIVQLRLFSGALYFKSYQEYLEACAFLGLATEKAQAGWVLAADGFILKDLEGRVGGGSGIRESPVAFIQSLMTTVRRSGEGIDKTHVGKMLTGRVLARSELE